MKMQITTDNPQTPEEIKAFYSDRYNYFTLCVNVSKATASERDLAVWYLKNVMLTLGYPAEVKGWDVVKTTKYARNIVMMG